MRIRQTKRTRLSASLVRRKGSDEKSPVKTKKKRPKSARMDDTSNNSLSNFMKKEGQTVQPPADKQEALEVRSAFTSYSRMRNKKIAATAVSSQASALGSRDRRDRRRKNTGDQLGSSFHSETSGMRRSRSLKELTKNSSSKRGGGPKKPSVKAFHESFNAFGNSSLSGSSSQHNEEFPDVPTFRKPLPDNPEDLMEANNETLFHQYQPTTNFASLPVLQEESRKIKKTKPVTKKIRKSTTSKKAVSQQELSDFLEQCNAKREQDEAVSPRGSGSKCPTSPLRSDRSCVSMPAVVSSPSGKAPRSTKSSKAPPNSRSTIGKRQQSQKSFQTTNSDPLPATKSTTTAGKPSSKYGPLMEKLAEKKTSRGRQGKKNRDQSRKKDRSGSQSEKTTATEASTIPSESFHSEDNTVRSLSLAKARKRPIISDRPRSLSRTRKLSQQQAKKMPSLLSSSARESLLGPSDSSDDESKKEKSRPKGMRKLFSIRDFTKCEEFESSDSSGSLGIIEKVPAAPTRAALTTSASNSDSQGHGNVSGAVQPETTLPPLVSLSPLDSSSRSRETSKGLDMRDRAKSPKKRYRFFPSEPNDNNEERHASSDLSEASKQLSSDSDTPYMPTSRQGDRASSRSSISAAGESSEERKAAPSITQTVTQVRETQLPQDDAFSDEDVFSHYTWAITVGDTEHDFEDTQRERVQMRDSIRRSLLYKAFEVIDMATR